MRFSSHRLKLAAVMALMLAVCVELLAFVAGKVLARQNLVYVPPPLGKFRAYVAERDAVLGWPGSRVSRAGERDPSGSRLVPAFPDPGAKTCVALFGDSFTWGDEVAPEDAYGNVLARRLGCRVANFGVGGYGTDQAVLRYEAIAPASPIVILGHQSDDIIRNVNQDRGFLTASTFGLKPRFVLENDHLRVIALPDLDEESYGQLSRHADKFFPLDPFRPGGPAGIVSLRFPFSVSVPRALGHYRLRARLRGEPSYVEFYRPGHPAGALELTVAIMERFVATARARGQVALVVLIPDVKDLQAVVGRRPLPYQPLVDSLMKKGLPFVSTTERMAAGLASRSPCDLYVQCGDAHFKPEGYRELAAVVERALVERGFLDAIPGSAAHRGR